MALFLSADFHQGDEHFSVHSTGKQCAFMSLSVLLTAQNISLSSWSKITFNNVLPQGDKLYLKAINTGFVMLDPGIDFLSVEHLPKAIGVSSSCINMSPVDENITKLPNSDLPVVVEPFVVNVTELPTHSKTTSPMRVTDIDSPIVVKPIEAQTNIDSPIVVKPIEAQTNIDSPITVKPIEAQTNIDSP
jgi:hypothetical protein